MTKFLIDGQYIDAATYKEAREIAKGGAGAAAVQLPAAQIGAPTLVAKAPIAKTPPIVPPKPVIPPKPVYQLAATAAVTGGEITVVHRADGRALTHSSIVRDKGFACQSGQWCIRELECARTFVAKLLDPALDTSKARGFEFANEILTPKKAAFAVVGKATTKKVGLADVMASIKRVLKDSRAFWVSTSLNSECGGYASNGDYNVYKFTLPTALTQYELVHGDSKNTLRQVAARSSDMTPTICFDGAPDGSTATIVAINSGPINDCEISFLTRLPLKWVEVVRAKA